MNDRVTKKLAEDIKHKVDELTECEYHVIVFQSETHEDVSFECFNPDLLDEDLKNKVQNLINDYAGSQQSEAGSIQAEAKGVAE